MLCRDKKVHRLTARGSMHGVVGEDIGDRDELVRRVHEELISLRGQRGTLTPQKFGQYPALIRVCGGNDLLDAYLMFERELLRYKSAGRDEAAAAISIMAPADNVLDRLEHAVGALLQDGALRDQRSARRWSDSGLGVIARDLVYFADVQGRLGTELLSVEVHGDEVELQLVIDQMTSSDLTVRAPLLRLWHYVDDEPSERQLVVDLDAVPLTQALKDGYAMRRHRVATLMPPFVGASVGTVLLGVSIEGRDAPMRTVAIQDHSKLPSCLQTRFSVYRTIALVEVVVGS